MPHNLDVFHDYYAYNGADIVMVENGQNLEIKHIGKVTLHTSSGSITLNNVLHVPQFKHNLLSISQLKYDLDCDFKFDPQGFVVTNRSGRIMFAGSRSQHL